VFDDQLPDSMTPLQLRFVATHVDGTQKVGATTADRLRRVGRRFLVLHYRLAIGDGPVAFRIGRRWATDFGFVRRHESWFWHMAGRRVYQRASRWYLMNPDSGWRAYWAGRVLREARLLHDDGVFADSLSVPQYLGAGSFVPPLRYFVGERAWMRRIDRFMRYERRRLHGRLWLIPNAGSMITTRDRTDYALADGVMVEGFAQPGEGAWYAADDWRLQLNRVLRLARLGRVLLEQSYLDAGDLGRRRFVLASYLLTKGRHSFVNMDVGPDPQWFPEYELRLGPPATSLPRSVDELATGSGVYARTYRNGVTLANPDSAPHRWTFTGTRWLAEPYGGGAVGPNVSTAGMGVRTRPVTGSLALAAHSGAVLLDQPS